jgi:hypothetical protein
MALEAVGDVTVFREHNSKLAAVVFVAEASVVVGE